MAMPGYARSDSGLDPHIAFAFGTALRDATCQAPEAIATQLVGDCPDRSAPRMTNRRTENDNRVT
jgi:hypothetical protein